MLLLPYSIVLNELEPVSEFFPLEKIIKAAKKVRAGLGQPLKGAPAHHKLFKIYLTSKSTPGRAVFLVTTKSGNIIPVLVRLKKDSVGKNISAQNPEFIKALEKNIELIKHDVKQQDFSLLSLD